MQTDELCYTGALVCVLVGVLTTGGALDAPELNVIAFGIGITLILASGMLALMGWAENNDRKRP